MMKKLIINADDFGYCQQRNKGILELCRKSDSIGPFVTSVSVMVNSHASPEVVNLVNLSQHPSISVGLHFNVTEGRPLLEDSVQAASGLTDENGYFLEKTKFHQALTNGNVNVKAVGKELEAQIDRFVELTGNKPTHVDGHQHAHTFPGVRDVFSSTLSKYDIEWSRIPIEMDVDKCQWLPKMQLEFFTMIAPDAVETKQIFDKNGIKFADRFVGLKTMGSNMTADRLVDQITDGFRSSDKNDPTIVELMVHPGYRAIEGVGGCGQGPDDFALSADREHEINILTGRKFRKFLSDEGITLSSFPQHGCRNRN